MGGKGRTNWHVDIQGQHDMHTFLRAVGSIGPRRSATANAIEDRLWSMRVNTNRDGLPKEAWNTVVQPAMKLAGVTTRQLHAGMTTQYSGSTLYRSGLSRERAARVAEVASASAASSSALVGTSGDCAIGLGPFLARSFISITFFLTREMAL